jgi:hypothetical protein
MTDSREEELIRRIERLERGRRWTWGLAGVVAAVFALTAFAGASDRVGDAGELKARAFVLVDDNGHTRGELGFLPGGEGVPATPGLVLWGKDGHIAAQLDGFPSFNLLGKDERSRMTLSVRSDDDPVLELIDSEGVRRFLAGRGDLKPARAEVTKQEPAFSLLLRGPDGKTVWKAP